jgi:[acyl-carrier-protein] S-malonyltransferase
VTGPVNPVAARVAGAAVPVAEVDAREALLRAHTPAAALPRPGTGEGRQLRRWITQLIVTERVIAAEAERLGVCADPAANPVPDLAAILPDGAARHDVGSVIAAALADPLARALYERLTRDVTVSDDEVRSYHRRNPLRFAAGRPGPDGWSAPPAVPPLAQVRQALTAHLTGAARRRALRIRLEARCAEIVRLAPGYEHPGDPRQPDNTHRH